MAEDNWGFDGDHYCEKCLPVPVDDERVFDASGEQDTPAHCCNCLVPLDYSLTSEGVDYVLEKLLEAIREGLDWKVYDCYQGTYYAGSPHCDIIADWAEEIRWYGGLGKRENIITRFLSLYEAVAPAGKVSQC